MSNDSDDKVFSLTIFKEEFTKRAKDLIGRELTDVEFNRIKEDAYDIDELLDVRFDLMDALIEGVTKNPEK